MRWGPWALSVFEVFECLKPLGQLVGVDLLEQYTVFHEVLPLLGGVPRQKGRGCVEAGFRSFGRVLKPVQDVGDGPELGILAEPGGARRAG
ncbi:hypothetical protein J2805_003793 [Arthrobacter oryzae]|nr:hypothetical protein [Arthrobacter oryzae]